MKTDRDAANSGIDTRQIVADGMNELMKAFGEMGERAAPQFETAKRAWLILQPLNAPPPRTQVDETRTRVINMRDGLLAANRFDWALLCTHATWWFSVILEG